MQAIRSLNVRQYPRSDLSVISVQTTYVGANADLVRGFLTTPLERVIASAEGIDYMESTSAQSLSTINVHLKLNFDTNAALTQIQAKVAQVRNDLPPEAEAPVIQVQTTDDQIAAMYLSFYSDVLQPNQITDYLTRVVQPKITAVNGVQRADILGARTFAMRIWLQPDKMAALGVAPTDVSKALAGNNYLSAVGATKGSMISVNLTANTDLRSAPEFNNLVVKQSGNTIIRLRDVATVELGAEDYNSDVRFDGSTATFMGVWVLPTANTLDVVHAVRKVVPEIEKSLPTGMKVGVPYDSTKYIEDAIHEVIHTMMETLLIVICVIFLFLGSWRSVIIPVVAIPVSLIGAVFLMLAFGFTINLLTLLAIVLSVGLVVDDAIVVVENVERHIQEGYKPLDAALLAAPRTRRPDHRHDDHPRRRVCPHRYPGRSDRRAFPRVRLYPRGRGHRLGRGRVDPLAHDVLPAPARGRRRARLRGLAQPALRLDQAPLRAPARQHAGFPSGHDHPRRTRHPARADLLLRFGQGTRSQGGSGRHLRHHPGRAEFHPRPDREVHRSFPQHGPRARAGKGPHVPTDLSLGRRRGLFGHGGQTVHRTQAHHHPDPDRDAEERLQGARHQRVRHQSPAPTRPAATSTSNSSSLPPATRASCSISASRCRSPCKRVA